MTGEDGEPWFVAADVCKAIGLASHKGSYKHHLEKLDEDERKAVARALIDGDPTLNMGVVTQAFVQSAGGAVWADSQVWLISESAVYTLILRGREATTPGSLQHQFKRWVTHEVLPSIRKSGSYNATQTPVSKQEKPSAPAIDTAWLNRAMHNAQTLMEIARGRIGMVALAQEVPDYSNPEIAFGLAAMFFTRQRLLLEIEDLDHSKLRVLRREEIIVDLGAEGWADQFMKTLSREQAAQIMHAATRKMT